MLFSVEQAFVGRDEKGAPLKTPVWEATPGDPATKVQKQSNPPIQGLQLTNKVDKSYTMPWYFPRVTPPGWLLISA